MKAIYKHEISSAFTSMTAYVFGAFLLLFGGIYTMVYNIINLSTHFEYVLDGIAYVFMLIVPVLTMRILAEERKQKTDQLLYSLPITMTEVVLGKYAAVITVFLAPMVIICCYPLILKLFGNIYFPAAYASVAGFFFLGAALIAVGVFVSAVTENQAVSAGLCFVVVMVNYFGPPVAELTPHTAILSLIAFTLLVGAFALIVRLMTKSSLIAALCGTILETGLLIWYLLDKTAFEGLFSKLMSELSLFERFSQFVNGIFDLRVIVYDVTVTIIFLFLSVQALEKRRWSE